MPGGGALRHPWRAPHYAVRGGRRDLCIYGKCLVEVDTSRMKNALLFAAEMNYTIGVNFSYEPWHFHTYGVTFRCGGYQMIEPEHLRRAGRPPIVLAALISLFLASGCDMFFGSDEATGAVTPHPRSTSITDLAGNTFSVGFSQVTDKKQNPWVEKRGPSGNQVWRIVHDDTTADARAFAIALDADQRPYVVFTIDGGSNDANRFQTRHVTGTPFAEAPFPSYGPGGGAKVIVVARLNPDTGRIERGTFLRARLNNGNTNTMNPEGIAIVDNTVQVDVISAAWPPAAGARHNSWTRLDEALFNDPTPGRPPLRITLPLDLTELSAVTTR